MLISTETESFSKLGDYKKTLTLLKDSGFTAYDFSMLLCDKLSEDFMLCDEYKEKAQNLREYADSIGLICNQTHAPFASAIKGDEKWNKQIHPKIVRAIEVSGILGAKICVIHPCNDYTPEENQALYQSFEPHARKAGVKIALENMWNWHDTDNHATPAACSDPKDFLACLSLLPSDVFVACLDIGHAEMAGLDTNSVQMIEALGDRLQALHIHDNDLHYDFHALPFTHKVDFEAIVAALKKIGYQGDITLECQGFAKCVPAELMPAAARYMADVCNWFKDRLEK
ncbi:MAG: sugar phosphate isomerase/epimerase [Clostridia bacterium]|nr:sugar phosphate isomerase/epimerase [Clostridia bacterium]